MCTVLTDLLPGVDSLVLARDCTASAGVAGVLDERIATVHRKCNYISISFKYRSDIVLGQSGRVQIANEHATTNRIWISVVSHVADLAHVGD